MVDSVLKELRKTLHTQVDGAWAKPEMLDAKDALSRKARELIEECYEGCIRGGGDVIGCYRKCAKEKNLGDEYRKIWGKA